MVAPVVMSDGVALGEHHHHQVGARAGVLAHARQLDPVVHVGPEGVGVPVDDLEEEVPDLVGPRRPERPVHGPERRVHPRLHRLDLLPGQEAHVAVDGLVQATVVLLGRGDPL